MSWFEVFENACRDSGQASTARRLGYSTAVVSQVLHHKYPGDIEKFQERVEAVLLKRVVECPYLGEIALRVCIDHQSRKFSVTNPLRVQMYRACRNNCPNSKLCGKD